MLVRRAHREERLGRLKSGRHPRCVFLPLTLVLVAGVILSCASSRGVYYSVRSGDTLSSIGENHGVSAREIRRANRIRYPDHLAVGSRLWIPNGGGATPDVAARPPSSLRDPRKGKGDAASSHGQYAARRDAVRSEVQRQARLTFDWPLTRGRLVSRYGKRWGRSHEGIDLAAPSGTGIAAAESGKVIHSGRLGTYGNTVIVSHAGSYRTLYAHARKTNVRRGQTVKKGQKIAEVGSTGNSTGPHLHFEIRRGRAARDPLLYLP